MILKNSFRLSLLFFFFGSKVLAQQRNLEVFPEKYQLDIPEEWKKPKLIDAITTILPKAVAELKEKEFCMTCKGGYTVRLIIEPFETISENITDQRAVKQKISYLYTLHYKFRAALGIYDSLEGARVEVLLVDPETQYTFTKEFMVPVATQVSTIYDQQGRPLKQNYTTEEKVTASSFVADHAKEFTPTLLDLMNIAEKKVFEVLTVVKKLKD